MKKLIKKILEAVLKLVEREVDRHAQKEPSKQPLEGPQELEEPNPGTTTPEEAPSAPTAPTEPVSTNEPKDTETAKSVDAVDPGELDWCWGGFNGSKADLADGCRIGSLKTSSSGMSYKWLEGGCERLGATSKEDCDHTLACLFVRQPGRWRGGKFDWISTSRTTRDTKNIKEGYHGWDYAAYAGADRYAFCIVSSDGKRRSNIISC